MKFRSEAATETREEVFAAGALITLVLSDMSIYCAHSIDHS